MNNTTHRNRLTTVARLRTPQGCNVHTTLEVDDHGRHWEHVVLHSPALTLAGIDHQRVYEHGRTGARARA